MNYKTFLTARLKTNDIEEKAALTKAYNSECSAARTAIAEFIYDKVKDTEGFKDFVVFDKYSIWSCRNTVEAMQDYLRHIYSNLRKRGRSKAMVESMFKNFQNQIGLTDFLQSDVVGDKYVHINRESGHIEVL